MKHELPPDKCRDCRNFHYNDTTSRSDTGTWYLDARCKLAKPTQDWYAKNYPDKRGGWIGENLEELYPELYSGYYYYQHALRENTRAKNCPLLKEGHMTVRQFITKLMDEVENLDELIDFYVTADQDKLREILDDDGTIDHNLDVDHLDDNGGTVHVVLDKIEW